MDVSKRIFSICANIEYLSLADIGTDHCLLPVFAVKSGKIHRAIASDINKGPLEKARENVRKEGLDKQIELRLGGGFSTIKAGECESAVISGMGGMLIAKIIKDDLAVALSFKQLILSPQSDLEYVRKTLHQCGFLIYNEDMVKDEGKFYNIIMAKAGEEAQYQPFQYKWGKIMLEKPNEDFKEYLRVIKEKNDNIMKKLALSSNEDRMEKLKTLELENNFISGWFENALR